MRQTRRSCRLLFLALLLGVAFHAFGQEATLLGTVTDPSGSVIPNATVTITNLDTGQVYPGKTNDSGQYSMPALVIGKYKVKIEASGFKAAERTDLVLNVADRARADFQMQVGDTSVTLNVEADAVKVQSDSSEISDVITGQQVTQLATNGRSLYSLAALTPGASSNMADYQVATPAGGDSAVSFNGMRQNHNIWLIDGGEDDDRGGAGGISVMPSIDSVAEFRALTSNYSAEYGLSSAGTMTIAFKSGTKDFHATAWEFGRNDALDAGNYFTNAAGKQAPELRLNVFGFNVGGPVYIPKVYNKDKNKTFFFYNMEWRKQIIGGLANQTVPPANEYGGQFNAPINIPLATQISSAQQNAISAALGLAPGTPFPGGQAFPGNRIPAALLSPVSQALLGAGIFPAPNNQDGTKFIGGAKLPTNVKEEIVRIDHQFSDKFWIFGHYVAEQVAQDQNTPQWQGTNVPTVGSTFGNPSYSGVVHATYSISPTLINETAFNYNGNRIHILPKGIFAQPSGLSIPELFAGNALNRIPRIHLTKGTGTDYGVGPFPWNNKADDYQIRDDVSWTKGSHSFKMGASFALYKKIQDLFGSTQGEFGFNGQYTGNDFADFLLGYSNSYNELAAQDSGKWDNKSYAAYFQDNWRVNSHLTLNLGLRWDGIPHTYEESNRGSNFYPNLYNPANAAIILPSGNISPSSPGLGTSPNPLLAGYQFYLNGIGLAGQNGIPPGLVQNHWATFGPRVGFAYDFTGSGKTVLRGGLGVMYERIQGNDMYNGGSNEPFSSSVTFNNISITNPNISLVTGQTLVAPITVGDITGLSNTDYKPPVSYQYSVSLQREVWSNSVLSVAYVGNQNRHQNDYRETNLPDPGVLPGLINGVTAYNTVVPYLGFHSIKMSENAENAHYNSLQVGLHSQIKKDLTLQVAYTLSRSIDPATSFGGDLAAVSDPYNRAYDIGPSQADRTHIGLVNFVYDLPIFRSNTNRLVHSTLGGWELSGIVTMETGLPLNVTLGGKQGSNGIPNATNRPDLTGSVSYPQTVAAWFSPAAFASPAVGAWGTLTKGAVRGPGRDNWNVSLFKSFTFSETRGSRFEIRFESFNTFNHTQFHDVSTTFSNSDFGKVTSAFDPRTFQLGAKLIF